MTDKPQDFKSISKLPKLPKIQGTSSSLPKLPTFNAAKKEAEKPKESGVIPALQASATQLPVVSALQNETEEEEGGATQAICQPSAEDLERALQQMREGLPISEPKPAASKPIPAATPAPAEAPALAPAPAASPALSLSPSLAPAPSQAPSLSPFPIPSKSQPAPSEDEPEEGGATQAISQPSAQELEQALKEIRGETSAPESGSAAKAEPAKEAHVSPISSFPSFGEKTNSPATPAASPFSAPSPSAAPAFAAPSPSAAPAFAAPAAAPTFSAPEVKAPEDNGPEFGGAASENNDLMFEDEDPDEAGEKTLMLDAAPDDDLDDIGGEKTQISLSSMDYDPLSGKLIVEAGKTNQREYILVREKTSIGRAPNNDITISDISMSRKHVEIDKFAEGFRLRDLDSGNGTILNGYRIRVGQLRDGDIIEIGSIRFRFEQSGGNPDELWKGEPKIEYHPNQKGGARPGAASSIHSSSPSYAAQPSSPSAAPAYVSQAPQPARPQIQMESMLERQGGGIAAAPSWASASPMTAPYMSSFSPNALRNVNTPPLWANIVLVALIIICLGSVGWWIFEALKHHNAEKTADHQNAVVERIESELDTSLNSYQDKDFDTAIKAIQNALELDKDGTLIEDKSLFENYLKLYNQEADLKKKITSIRDKDITNYSMGKAGIAEIEEDLDFLQNSVPDDSINKQSASRTYSRKLEIYTKRLKGEIRDYVSSDEIAEAQKLLVKLSNLPETESDVKNFKKLISDKEKTKN